MDCATGTTGDLRDWPSLLDAHSAPHAPIVSEQVKGRRVLITGAGGSIGSALARAAWASSAASLILLDTSENGLYHLDRSLREAGSRRHVCLLGSVCDRDHLSRYLEQHRPEVVFHAAAFKHVPLMESNPFAAIQNNAVGTHIVAEASSAAKVDTVVLVSTDKAADPHSIMGASKRLAELALLAAGERAGTRRIAVRLGNVVGSQGSVLPLFLEQIARGGPVTVTHPAARRYFMTMDAAVTALISAMEFPSSPALLVPSLGTPLSILDLARHLIAIHHSGSAVEWTGLRPGDKLSESLLSSGERWAVPPGANPGGLREVLTNVPPWATVDAALRELSALVRAGNLPAVLRVVATLVPEYRPSAAIAAALEPEAALP